MGWRIKLICGDEWDAVSRRARRILNFRSGEKSAAKRSIHKRARRLVKREIVSQDQP